MKNKNPLYVLLLPIIVFIASCNRPSPDEFFQTTILNTNILREFASERFTRDLIQNAAEIPGAPAGSRTGNEARQIVEAKISYLEQTIKRITDATPPDEDGEQIKVKALDLYEFVLPVYQNEYLKLATMCDEGVEEADIKTTSEGIISSYGPAFEEKYLELLELGQAYAQKHNINASFGG